MSGLPQALSVATFLRTKFPHDYHSQPTCLETHQTEGIDTLEVTFRQTKRNELQPREMFIICYSAVLHSSRL